MSKRSGMFLSETHTDAVQMVFSVEDVLFQGKTPYQDVQVVNIPRFGKSVFLDLGIQSAQLDEFIFHDAMVHPAMSTHPDPKKVLIAGGGEGATLRDVLKHKTVQSATMIDIDEEFVNICRKWLPEWSDGAYEDPRTKLVHADARRWLQESNDTFDVILSDLTNPLEAGPAVYLFTKEYFQLIHDHLSDDGVFAMQAGCANNNYPYLFVSLIKTLQEVYPIVRPYWAFVTTFMMPWGFILASKKHDPLEIAQQEIEKRMREREFTANYYSPAMHHGMFALPPYIDQMKEQFGRVLTDAEPYYWQA